MGFPVSNTGSRSITRTSARRNRARLGAVLSVVALHGSRDVIVRVRRPFRAADSGVDDFLGSSLIGAGILWHLFSALLFDMNDS